MTDELTQIDPLYYLKLGVPNMKNGTFNWIHVVNINFMEVQCTRLMIYDSNLMELTQHAVLAICEYLMKVESSKSSNDNLTCSRNDFFVWVLYIESARDCKAHAIYKAIEINKTTFML